jgi:cupin 2 domain-containing protein
VATCYKSCRLFLIEQACPSMDKSPRQGNMFANIPQELPEELFETLVSSQQLRIERIVSRQHVTADGDWSGLG